MQTIKFASDFKRYQICEPITGISVIPEVTYGLPWARIFDPLRCVLTPFCVYLTDKDSEYEQRPKPT